MDSYIVYFFQLPLGRVIKIGKSSIRRFNTRIVEAQRYFVDKVKILGIEDCDSKDHAYQKEQHLLNHFGRLNPPKGELVQDTPSVRYYIDCYCRDGYKELNESKTETREYDKQRKQDVRAEGKTN